MGERSRIYIYIQQSVGFSRRQVNNIMDYPDYFAKFYDVIYDHMRSDVDLDYYLGKISATKGPVLEIGVGTGRLFTVAINNKADIYGIDISQSMINILLIKLDPEHHNRISLQDAVDFTFDKKFDLIIAPFRVYSHLTEVEDQLKALNNAARHLTDTGRLIFDLYVPDPGMIASGLKDVKDFEGEYEPGRTFSRTVNMVADIVHQISDITMTMKWMELDQEHTEDFNFKFRFYFRYEVEHLVARSALTLEHMYGDFNENEMKTGSREMVVVCRK